MSTQPTAVTGSNALVHGACKTAVILIADEMRDSVLVRRYSCPKCQCETADLIWVDV